MGVYADLLAMAQTKVAALSLAGITSNVHVMKLPGVEDEIDTLPMVAVVPSEDDQVVRPASFENQAELSCSIDMVIINKGKKLLAGTGNTIATDNLYTQTDWQQTIWKAFYNPRALGITGLWKTDIRPGRPVDRERVNQNYDYIPVTVRFRVLTQGTN